MTSVNLWYTRLIRTRVNYKWSCWLCRCCRHLAMVLEIILKIFMKTVGGWTRFNLFLCRTRFQSDGGGFQKHGNLSGFGYLSFGFSLWFKFLVLSCFLHKKCLKCRKNIEIASDSFLWNVMIIPSSPLSICVFNIISQNILQISILKPIT